MEELGGGRRVYSLGAAAPAASPSVPAGLRGGTFWKLGRGGRKEISIL